MQAEGFNVSDVQPDGKVHRFKREPKDKKKNAWYICFLNHTRNQEPFLVCKFGDWRDQGGEFDFISLQKRSREDDKFIRNQIEQAQKKKEIEQNQVWEETSLEVSTEWPLLSNSGPSEYLLKKKIDIFGVKVDSGKVYVPVRDEEGKLWSIQTIFPDGDKLFSQNGRIKGNFHLIGSAVGAEALVCEGYATGASLHMATGLPVLVCFFASNMPEVCRKFPDALLTVCRDDDVFTPEERGGNAGIKWSARCAASRVVSPKFSNLDTKPTDFNDLHLLEGLDLVRKQVLNSEVEKNFYTCLGHKDIFYYYLSSSNRQIVRISRDSHNKNSLRDLMPDAFWAALFPTAKGEGVNWDAAADTLMSKCRKRGIFDDDAVRGVGVWKDQETYLINCGENLFYNNQKHQLDAIKSEYIYEIGRKIEPPILKPLAASEGRALLECLELLNFSSPDSYKLLAGWIVVGPLGGALEWRPHVWLTGGVGSGKTTVAKDIVQKMVKKYSHILQGSTTEAGIRQTVKSDSKAVLFDEFETDDEESGNRVRHALELMRQASSETDGKVAKGSPSGQAVYYHPKFCAFVSSVRVQLLHEADRSRFTVLELVRKEDSSNYDTLKQKINKLSKIYADQFFARSFKLLPILKENINVLWEELRDNYSARVGQQYGTLLAGYWIIEHDSPISKAEAKELCASMNLSEARQVADDKDENECFDFLMRKIHRVNLPSGQLTEKSFSEMIRGVHGTQVENEEANGVFEDPLQRLGVRVTNATIYIAQSHPELSRIFFKTKWAGGWSKSLSRITGAVNGVNKRIGGRQTKCVSIPVGEIFDQVPF